MFKRRRKQSDFNAEVEAHIALEADRQKEQGLNDEEAQAAARRAFGNLTQARERFYEANRWRWWDELRQDVRYGLRQLRRNPGFTAVAVLTLALGIGANTAMFSFVDTLYLRPLPVGDAGQLVDIFQTRGGRGYYDLSYPDYTFYRDNSQSLSDLAAQYPTAPLSLVASGELESVGGSVVTSSYFHVLELKPFIGRFFFPEEDEVPDRDPVTVISYGLWKRQFASDPNILGKIIQLNGTAFTIVGIAPENFRGAMPGVPETDVWIPSAMFHVGYRYCDAFQRNCTILSLLGRLKPGHTLQEVQAEMDVLAHRLEAAYPKVDEGLGIIVTSKRGMPPWEKSENGLVAKVLMAAVGLVLLIACANSAGLLLARSAGRRKEINVRLALGARRSRLVWQLLTESLILALAGGVLGLLIATWGIKLLSGFYTVGEEGGLIYITLGLDPTVLGFTLALSAITGIAFGLFPAVQASRPDVVGALKDQVSSSSRHARRLRHTLVTAQVALSIVLLVGVALLVTSVRNIYHGPGFDPAHLISLRLRPSLVGYDLSKGWKFQQEVIRKLDALPGVVAGSPAGAPPVPWGFADSVWLPGHEPSTPASAFIVGENQVGPRYFETLGVPIVQGREFDNHDTNGTLKVAIVNQTLARHFWPARAALARVLIVGGTPFQIVGVAPDAQYHSSLEPPPPFIYLDYWQQDTTNRWNEDSRTLVRVSGKASAMLPVLRKAIAAVDPNVPINEDRTVTEWLDTSFRTVRMTSTFFTCFGALALFLSAIALYGVLTFTVSQRTHEIGIRMALGAEKRDVLGMVVGQGLKLALIGVAIGIVGALALTRFLSSLLYGVTPTDPLTFIAVSLVLIAVALAACYIPARRAAKVDPMVALRYE